jgi:hypothetical protein
MTVRAKVKLTSIEEYEYGSKKLKFQVQYDSTVSEDISFCKATPYGNAEFSIDNPAAIERFKLGDYYYVDFSPVAK